MTSKNRSVVIPNDIPGKLLLAAQCGLPLLPSKVKQQIAPLLSYESMAILAGTALAVAGAHAVGIGFAVDVILGGVTFAMIGSDMLQAGNHAVNFYKSASNAKNASEFDLAGKEFAAFVSLAGINTIIILLSRGRAGKLTKSSAVDIGATRAAWFTYINRIKFLVPKDKGILWTKIGSRSAERLAVEKGLVSLEMLLKEEGFYELYSKQFGSTQNNMTSEIWKMISKRYVASLEGKVTAYVSQKNFRSAVTKGHEPVLVDELWEISESLQMNSKIQIVEMIDVSTGRKWMMEREAVLRAVKSVH